MEQYIPKSVIVAEIEKRQKEEVSYDEDGSFASWADQNHYSTLETLKNYVNTFKAKEVDLEKKLTDWLGDRVGKWTGEECENMCRYFFELGLEAQKDSIRHSMDKTPNYPCDILFVSDVDNMFLFKYMENGRPVDRETPYFHNIQNGKCWYYCNDIMNVH